MGSIPFQLPVDVNFNAIAKFLDAFESVRFDMTTEPKYYGDLHPDGYFVIRKHENTAGDEHITFYLGLPVENFSTAWTNKASLTYVEYNELY